MGRVIYPALTRRRRRSASRWSSSVLGTLAGLYPAVRAARRVPVEAITRG